MSPSTHACRALVLARSRLRPGATLALLALLALASPACGPSKGEEGGECHVGVTGLEQTRTCNGDLVCDAQSNRCRRPRSVTIGGSCNAFEWSSSQRVPLCAEGLSCRYVGGGLRPGDVACGFTWCCEPGPPHDACGSLSHPPCCPGDPRCSGDAGGP